MLDYNPNINNSKPIPTRETLDDGIPIPLINIMMGYFNHDGKRFELNIKKI
jgi:hypothetical protein